MPNAPVKMALLPSLRTDRFWGNLAALSVLSLVQIANQPAVTGTANGTTGLALVTNPASECAPDSSVFMTMNLAPENTGQTGDPGIATATATWINEHQFITAAHNLQSIQGGSIAGDGGTRSTFSNWQVHPKYNPNGSTPDYDVGVVTVDNPPAGHAIATIASQAPSPGSLVWIAGYGSTSAANDDIGADNAHRCGQNTTVAPLTAGLIAMYGTPNATDPQRAPGTGSLCGSGDSGGPMMNYAGELVGGCVQTDENGQANSEYVDYNSQEVHDFLTAAVKPGTLPASYTPTSYSGVPQADRNQTDDTISGSSAPAPQSPRAPAAGAAVDDEGSDDESTSAESNGG